PEPATTGTERLPPSGSAAASGITNPCRRNACASSDCACREASCAAPWPPASCPPASATCSSCDVASSLSWFDPYPALCSTLRNKVRTVTGDPKELYYEEAVRCRQGEPRICRMCLLVLRFTNRWHECIEDSDYGNLLQVAASRENEQGKKPCRLCAWPVSYCSALDISRAPAFCPRGQPRYDRGCRCSQQGHWII